MRTYGTAKSNIFCYRCLKLKCMATCSALQIASEQVDPAVMRALLQSGADDATRAALGRLLVRAAQQDDAAAVTQLLEAGADSDFVFEHAQSVRCTALLGAAQRGHAAAATALLRGGANRDWADAHGRSVHPPPPMHTPPIYTCVYAHAMRPYTRCRSIHLPPLYTPGTSLYTVKRWR